MKPLRPNLANGATPYLMGEGVHMNIYFYVGYILSLNLSFAERERRHIENSLYEKIIQSTHTRNR